MSTKRPPVRLDSYPFHNGSPEARRAAMGHSSTVTELGWSLVAVALGAAGGFVFAVCYLIAVSR